MKMYKKSDLPTKLCVTFGLASTWRMQSVWNDAKYCPQRCRRVSKGGNLGELR
jgi:hypothetical protein